MTRTRIDRAARALGLRACGQLSVGLCVWLVTLASAPHARADPLGEREQARGHFTRGVELAKQRSYEAALAEFSRAYDLSPHFSVLYNIGQADVALGRHAAAAEVLERYLSEGAERLDAARRAEVEATLQREVASTALLDIDVDTAGARIEVDGVARGQSPLPGPLRLDLGSHQLHVFAASGRERELTVQLSNAGPARTRFELIDPVSPKVEPVGAAAAAPLARAPVSVASSPPTPTPTPTPTSVDGGDSRKTWGYVLGSAGVALAGVGLVHYAWNAGRHTDWNNEYNAYYLDPQPERRDAANQLARSIQAASKVTVGLFVGAGVALGAGSWLLLSSRDRHVQMRASLRSDALISVGGAF
jgi:hypothetical protein